jgi:uncharacterized Rmd1/YagE family protein
MEDFYHGMNGIILKALLTFYQIGKKYETSKFIIYSFGICFLCGCNCHNESNILKLTVKESYNTVVE